MYRTVIAELTATDLDDAIVRIAVDQALRHDAKLVLHRTVVRPETCDVRFGQPPMRTGHDDMHLTHDKKAAILHIEKLRHAHHLFARTEPMVTVGDPVVQVQFLARLYPAPLVVTAATCEAYTAQRIMAAVPCPVLVVPETSYADAGKRPANLAAIA